MLNLVSIFFALGILLAPQTGYTDDCWDQGEDIAFDLVEAYDELEQSAEIQNNTVAYLARTGKLLAGQLADLMDEEESESLDPISAILRSIRSLNVDLEAVVSSPGQKGSRLEHILDLTQKLGPVYRCIREEEG